MIAPCELRLGQSITFRGYADDYGGGVKAVQFSLDGGKTWDTRDLPNASLDRCVYWSYRFVPLRSGRYQLKVRSVSEDGRTSPEAAVADFHVLGNSE